jgi:hypothetical protein
MECGVATFWGWYPTKKLSNPMVTFFVSYIYFFGENGSSNYVQNCLLLSKNHKEILGLKIIIKWSLNCEM